MYYAGEIVEEVRERCDIVDLIGSYVKLKRQGSSYVGLCPFHSEKSPSFSVSPTKQMYYCFGCGAGGNVFTFMMQYENYSFLEAVERIAERTGISLPKAEYSEEERRAADLKSRLLEVNKLAAKYYHYTLRSKEGAGAYRYFKERGLADETITGFGLGFSDKTGKGLYRYLKEKGYEDAFLKETGLFHMDEKGSFDKFWNRAMFPIMDINNRVIGFGGRVMGDGMPKYLNSPETKLFDKSRNLYALNFARQSRRENILLCEGYMDVIALHQAGFNNAVASLGTSFTGLQAKLLSRYTKEVLITYDSDGAGVKAALRAIPILREAGIRTKVVDMTPYKDPDEFIKALGAEEYEKRMERAKGSFFFELDVLKQDFDFSDPEQKTRFFHETAKKLLAFEEELERNNYLEAVAREYLVSFDMLHKLVNQYGASQSVIKLHTATASREPYQKKQKADEGNKKSQRLLLTWLTTDTALFEKIKGIITPEDFTEEIYREVAAMVFEEYEREAKVTPAKILNRYETKEEQAQVAEIFQTTLLSGAGEAEQEKAFSLLPGMSEAEQEKAFLETVRKVKQAGIDAKMQRAAEENDAEALQQAILAQAALKKLR